MFVTGSSPPFRPFLKIRYPQMQVMHQYPINSIAVMGNRHCLNHHRALRFLYHYQIKGISTEQQVRQSLEKTVQERAGEYCIKSERQLFFLRDFLIRYEPVRTIRHRDLKTCTFPGVSVLINGYSGYGQDLPYKE
jgi:hypothetical protein